MSHTVLRQAQITGPEGLLPISHATLWRWVAKGTFPRPYKLSAGVTVWNRAQVEAWLSARQGGADHAA